MRLKGQSGKGKRQTGSALIIAIFALLLISVVGIALLISTGSDSALTGNYRNSAAAYYAAVAGLEEARGRLLAKNPDFLNIAVPNYVPPYGGALDVHNVLYILNPATGETVSPVGGPYPDTEYGTEFTWGLTGATIQTTSSVSPLSNLGLQGPQYKWVRVNPVTEQALGIDVDGQSANDGLTPLYYNGAGMNRTATGAEALEITALAYLPDKSTKLLQYVVVPNTIQNFLAPPPLLLSQALSAGLILAGNGVSYNGPSTSGFYVNGNDPTTGRSCTTPPWAPVYAVGYTNPGDQADVVAGTNAQPGNYTGLGPAPPAPSVGVVTLPSTLQTPSQFEALIQAVTQSADSVVAGSTNRGDLPSTMSATNPMTVVVNGNLDLTSGGPSHVTGYGLLLVTGTLNYDPDVTWEGIVLVIGRGVVVGSKQGIGRVDGAMIVAQTRDASGNVLPDPNLGASTVNFASNMGGAGVYFNSCTILQALAPSTYRALSFREIAQ
jgi:hypothetical protein